MLSHDIILIKLKGKKAKEYVLNYMARQMRITFKEIPKEEIVLQEKGKKEIARHIFEQSLEQDFCSEIEFEVTNEDNVMTQHIFSPFVSISIVYCYYTTLLSLFNWYNVLYYVTFNSISYFFIVFNYIIFFHNFFYNLFHFLEFLA